MTVGTLAVYMLAEPEYGAAVASTMLLTTLSLFHVVAGYMARDPLGTVFDRDALPGATQLRRYGLALAAIVLVTMLGFLQRIFSTVELGFNQWAICVGIALSLLVVEEVIKLFLRRGAATRDQ
jgi:Ca2+-transporting ATPase